MDTSNVYSFFHSSKTFPVAARKIASVLTMVAMVFGSFAPIVAFPSSVLATGQQHPDLVVVKTNDLQGGSAVVGTTFHWVLTITNNGNSTANFDEDDLVLKDQMPTGGATYGTPVAVLQNGVSGSIHCSVSFSTLLCSAGNANNGHLNITNGKTITITVPVTPTGSGSLVNPKAGGVCVVDPVFPGHSNGVVFESNETNNSCSNTVSVIPNTAVLTVTKVVNGGTKVVSDFPLSLNGLSITSSVATTTKPGTYTVTEVSDPAYTGVFSGDCNSDGQVTLSAGDHKACTLTNTVHPSQIVVHKVINNTGGGTATFSSFSYTVNDGSSVNFDASGNATTTGVTGAYSVVEDNNASYSPAYSAGCSGTIAAGETKDCTITNTYIIPEAPSCDAQLSNTTFVSDETTMVGADPAVHTWVHPLWLPESGGAEWIWSTSTVADPSATTTVDFTKTFSVTGTITGGTLQIAADNGYAVTLNGNPVCSADAFSNHYAAFDTCIIPASSFVAGTNTLAIEVVNAAYDTQDPHTNPAGVMYKLTVDKNACIPQSNVTICKYDDQQHPLSGWTMTLKGDNVEDVTVPSNLSIGTSTLASLASGVSYIATAVGTWLNQNGANPVDAEYSTTDNWATHMDGYTGYQTDILELQINQAFDPNSNWGAYNSAHTYAQAFTGAGAPAHFRIFDGGSIGATSTTPNESWYGDNSGTLAVNVSKGYAGITAANGCVTFNAVPTGSYTLGEVMQDGWNNVSGLGQVVVTHATEAFNVVNHYNAPAPECNPNATSTIISDATTQEDDHDSVLVSFIHASWTAIISGASWIWGEDPVADPANPSTETFTKTFNIVGTPLGATLDLAADNTFSVSVNGNAVCSSNAEDNFSATTTCAIPASSLLSGANTMVFTVTNLKLPDDWQGPVNGQTNPAGLLYKLTINNNECQTPEASFVKVHLYKYLETHDGNEAIDTQVPDDSTLAPFPMIASWEAANLNGGASTTGSYVLGNNHGGASLKYAADTSPMQVPVAHYTSYEDTNDTSVLPIGAECSEGKFRLVGYKSGPTLEAAEGASLQPTAPDFTNFNIDKYVIVVNEDCKDVTPPGPTTGTLTIVKHTIGGQGTFGFNVTATSTQEQNSGQNQSLQLSTIETTDNSATSTGIALTPGTYDVTENAQNGWNLTGHSCVYSNESVGAPIAGGEEITLDAGDNVTCTFTNTDTTSIADLSVAKTISDTTPDAGQSVTYTITVTNNGPADATGVTATDHLPAGLTYVSDDSNGAYATSTGIWTIGSLLNASSTSLHIIATVNSGTAGDQIINTATASAVNADTNEENNSDSASATVNEPAPGPDNTPVTTQGGGGGGNGPVGFFGMGGSPFGVVLGASTSTVDYGPQCERYITDFIKPGANNNPTQVARVQYVLAVLEGLKVPQNGAYDSATIAGVHSFQTKYASQILGPWGIGGSTGYVYLTTRKMLNEVYCENKVSFPLTAAEQAIIDAARGKQGPVVATGGTKTTTPKSTTVTTPPTTGTTGATTGQTSETAAAVESTQSTTTTNGGFWGWVRSLFGGK